MQSISLKKVTVVGFLGPLMVILGAFISVALGHGQVIMLPSTVAALTFYGVLIAAGAAWRDGAPQLFRWAPNLDSARSSRQTVVFATVLCGVFIVLAAIAWIAATHGISGLVWRPILTSAVCVWLGVGLGSVVRPRVCARN